MFSVLVIRLRSLRLLRVSGIVMRLRMFLLLITFLKASHSFRNRLLVICKNAYLFATMIMTSVSSPLSCRSEERRVGKECRSRWGAYQEKKTVPSAALVRLRGLPCAQGPATKSASALAREDHIVT